MDTDGKTISLFDGRFSISQGSYLLAESSKVFPIMILENPFSKLIPKRRISPYHFFDYRLGLVVIPLVATDKSICAVNTWTCAYNKPPISMLVPTLKFRMLALSTNVCCNFLKNRVVIFSLLVDRNSEDPILHDVPSEPTIGTGFNKPRGVKSEKPESQDKDWR